MLFRSEGRYSEQREEYPHWSLVRIPFREISEGEPEAKRELSERNYLIVKSGGRGNIPRIPQGGYYK